MMTEEQACPHCDADLQNGWCEPCDKLINCCFPDCGCDGARVCMAENGASEDSNHANVEGMWHGNKYANRNTARKRSIGRMRLLALVDEREAGKPDQ